MGFLMRLARSMGDKRSGPDDRVELHRGNSRIIGFRPNGEVKHGG